jgi:hypothetical protein
VCRSFLDKSINVEFSMLKIRRRGPPGLDEMYLEGRNRRIVINLAPALACTAIKSSLHVNHNHVRLYIAE